MSDGLTLAEKIIAAHVAGGDGEARAGQIVVARVDLAIAQDGTGPLTVQQIRELNGGSVEAPRAVFFIDHAAPPPRAELADAQAGIRGLLLRVWGRALGCGDGQSAISEWRRRMRGPGTW